MSAAALAACRWRGCLLAAVPGLPTAHVRVYDLLVGTGAARAASVTCAQLERTSRGRAARGAFRAARTQCELQPICMGLFNHHLARLPRHSPPGGWGDSTCANRGLVQRGDADGARERALGGFFGWPHLLCARPPRCSHRARVLIWRIALVCGRRTQHALAPGT